MALKSFRIKISHENEKSHGGLMWPWKSRNWCRCGIGCWKMNFGFHNTPALPSLCSLWHLLKPKIGRCIFMTALYWEISAVKIVTFKSLISLNDKKQKYHRSFIMILYLASGLIDLSLVCVGVINLFCLPPFSL